MASQATIWAPHWKQTIAVVIPYWIIVLVGALLGLNVYGALVAGLGGVIGGAVGAVAGMPFGHTPGKTIASRVLFAIGFAVGGVVTAILVPLINQAMPSLVGLYFVLSVNGAAAGAVCGLLPQLMLQERFPNFGNMSYWICIAVGVIGAIAGVQFFPGVPIVVPIAVILTLVGKWYPR